MANRHVLQRQVDADSNSSLCSWAMECQRCAKYLCGDGQWVTCYRTVWHVTKHRLLFPSSLTKEVIKTIKMCQKSWQSWPVSFAEELLHTSYLTESFWCGATPTRPTIGSFQQLMQLKFKKSQKLSLAYNGTKAQLGVSVISLLF